MSNVIEIWKTKYPDPEIYRQKVQEYKDKLSTAAKKSRAKGPRDVRTKKICTKCKKEYLGVHNQLICNDCKKSGYTEICKHCGEEFFKTRYSNCCDKCFSKQPWKRIKHTPERIQKAKEGRALWLQTDAGQEFQKRIGRLNSENMKRFNQTRRGRELIKEKAEKMSISMKEKIALGLFTPRITNTRTHWDAKIILENGEIKKFRSSWEAAFWATNQQFEFEILRIPWVDQEGKFHTYIPDFFDRSNNTIYEIKPRSRYETENIKMQCAIKYCIENKIKFIWINEKNILNYIDANSKIFLNEENLKQLNKVINAVTKN